MRNTVDRTKSSSLLPVTEMTKSIRAVKDVMDKFLGEDTSSPELGPRLGAALHEAIKKVNPALVSLEIHSIGPKMIVFRMSLSGGKRAEGRVHVLPFGTETSISPL